MNSMALFILISLVLAALFTSPATSDDPFVGVNIGTSLSDMPHPTQTVALLKSQRIRHVRLYDADTATLLALAKTGIEVTISVPNDQLLAIGKSNATAAKWVSQNILAHYPATNITTVCVGSDILTSLPNAAPILVDALNHINSALLTSNLNSKIKVSTPLSTSIILDSFPPSQAFFNHSLHSVLVPLLNFLQTTGSPLMLNVYPYYDYMLSNGVFPLDYALFKPLPPNKEAVDSNTMLHYRNVFDATIDAAYFAMEDLNFTAIPILVTESGWPSKGDPGSEPDATTDNANTYNTNLIKHVLAKTGTPKHPNVAISTYIYELFNEDMKPGSVSEKNWGLFDSSGKPVYVMRLTGSGSVLANDTTGDNTFCAAKGDADKKLVQAALDWACGPGRVDCEAIKEGNKCYEPDSVVDHATYAFDSYYRKMGKDPASCDFNGVAEITTSNPSHGSCVYRSTGANGTLGNALAPSMHPMSSGAAGATYLGFLTCILIMSLGGVFL